MHFLNSILIRVFPQMSLMQEVFFIQQLLDLLIMFLKPVRCPTLWGHFCFFFSAGHCSSMSSDPTVLTFAPDDTVSASLLQCSSFASFLRSSFFRGCAFSFSPWQGYLVSDLTPHKVIVSRTLRPTHDLGAHDLMKPAPTGNNVV